MSYICDETESKKIASIIKDFTGKIFWDHFLLEFKKSPFSITLKFYESNYMMGKFTLIQQVNCCGILVSTQTQVSDRYQNKGIAQEMMFLKEALAKEFGFSLLLATVNMTGNPTEVHILEKFGWKLNTSFVNSRTKNTVGVFTKEIK